MSALAAKRATSTIPIIFYVGGDPVKFGLVASYNRPDGNLTGVTSFSPELIIKRLEVLYELVPKGTVIGLLANPTNALTESLVQEIQAGGRSMGVKLSLLNASSEDGITVAFATLVGQQIGALVIQADPFFTSRTDQIVALAARYRVPAIYQWRAAQAGGLLSYGPSVAVAYRQIATYIGKILKGASPTDLPVVQPTRLELVINLTTAKALGLSIPESILLRADEVIE
jgi:putative ABC transport system substrate-binding protein